MVCVSQEELDPQHLLVLYAVNKAPYGVPTKTHYQKMMYLVLKALGNDPRTSAGYVPDHYGPYSAFVDQWRSALLDYGYLKRNSSERITINPEVQSDVDSIHFPDKIKARKIENISEFVNSLTYRQLLLYIYSEDVIKNEGMTEQSDVINEIFASRRSIAASMVKSDKVSLEKGAELADMDILDFKKYVRKSGTNAYV